MADNLYMKKYFRLWTIVASLSVQANLTQRGGALLFMLGKFIRFGFFLFFIVLIGERVNQVSGYSLDQMIIFFLFFNLFDILGQLLFRGIYGFRQQVLSGEFDFRLIKPVSPLFQVLTRQTDILDTPLLIIVLLALGYYSLGQPLVNLLPFLLLTANGLLIVTAVHIFVAGLGIITTEVDHTIMIFRDFSSMARFPIDIYALPVRTFLTLVIPVAIAYTVPAQAFLGLLQPQTILFSLVIGSVFFFLSLIFWRYALTQYSSASS